MDVVSTRATSCYAVGIAFIEQVKEGFQQYCYYRQDDKRRMGSNPRGILLDYYYCYLYYYYYYY